MDGNGHEAGSSSEGRFANQSRRVKCDQKLRCSSSLGRGTRPTLCLFTPRRFIHGFTCYLTRSAQNGEGLFYSSCYSRVIFDLTYVSNFEENDPHFWTPRFN